MSFIQGSNYLILKYTVGDKNILGEWEKIKNGVEEE